MVVRAGVAGRTIVRVRPGVRCIAAHIVRVRARVAGVTRHVMGVRPIAGSGAGDSVRVARNLGRGERHGVCAARCIHGICGSRAHHKAVAKVGGSIGAVAENPTGWDACY